MTTAPPKGELSAIVQFLPEDLSSPEKEVQGKS